MTIKFDVKAAEKEAYDRVREFENNFEPSDEYKHDFQDPEWERLWAEWRKLRDTCPKCCRDDSLERRNYDMMWGDTDLFCGRCNVKIRSMDFG